MTGVIALSITPIASFADHLEPKESQIRSSGNLVHTNLRGQSLSGADLRGAYLIDANLSRAELSRAHLSGADLTGITGTNLTSCPSHLPPGWVCENNSLNQR